MTNPASGSLQWAADDPTPHGSFYQDLAIDRLGNVILACTHYGVNGALVDGASMRTLKYAGATGAQLWSRDLPLMSDRAAQHVAVRLDRFGAIYVSGSVSFVGRPDMVAIAKWIDADYLVPRAGDFNGDGKATSCSRTPTAASRRGS